MRRLNPALVRMVVLMLLGCMPRADGLSRTVTDAAFPLQFVADIPVGVAGAPFARVAPRFDYESIDERRRLLFVAYLGESQVLVFDLSANKVIARIPNVPAVHGVLAVPGLDTVYASATGADQVAVIDERRLTVTARIAGGTYPDGIAYDPIERKIFVSDESGGTDTVINVRNDTRVAGINLGGEAGNTQYDPVSRRVFADVQTRNDLVAIDPVTDRIVVRYPLPGCEHDHGLLLDSGHRLAFVACDGNAKLLVVDMRSMKVRSTFSVGTDPDVLAFDERLRRLYVSSESGVVGVFQERGSSLVKLGETYLADEAHTVAVDQQTHRVYFALQGSRGHPVIRVMEPAE